VAAATACHAGALREGGSHGVSEQTPDSGANHPKTRLLRASATLWLFFCQDSEQQAPVVRVAGQEDDPEAPQEEGDGGKGGGDLLLQILHRRSNVTRYDGADNYYDPGLGLCFSSTRLRPSIRRGRVAWVRVGSGTRRPDSKVK
jgi:hypothetical protein